jgi:3-deoxy-D-manno-octulosonic acid (KDO) 8-phosphate synthase
MEVHSDIENAQSDKESQLELKNFEEVIDGCMALHDLVSK